VAQLREAVIGPRGSLRFGISMPDIANEKRRWRKTRLTLADSSPIPDDWTLEDEAGQPLGRIYAETGGPQDGRWF